MKTKIMGILNITPDSCYDGGQFSDHKKALDHALKMIDEGADWIDIGGESTRPFATPVPYNEERARVIPLIKELKKHTSIPLSIDTMKPEIAKEALSLGVKMINDVSGFSNPEMITIAAESGCYVCVMHMQGTPKTMQISPSYPKGVLSHLTSFFQNRIEKLTTTGVKKEAIIVDPGIGFGKTVAHNLEILENLKVIGSTGFPILLGISRKGFLGKILNQTRDELLPATLAFNTRAMMQGVDYIRVHDVREHKKMIETLKGL
ncbi:dihydropteroate synthase [Chlamydiales bacterium]|nr:dihydropteroate synthase [Chlamydiales bacterium]